jgi:hypothetical protein
MRILIFEQVKKEMDSNAAFNVALLRAIDPRIITHRPRDPEKARLMAELGMETTVPEVKKEVEHVHVRVNVGESRGKRKGLLF